MEQNTINCQNLVDDYFAWFRSNISISEINGAYSITTPFLDRHNDHLQLFMMAAGDRMRLTDDSHILSDLRQCGYLIDIDNQLIETVLNSFNVSRNDDELFVETSLDVFPHKMNSLIQAMLAINYMTFSYKI